MTVMISWLLSPQQFLCCYLKSRVFETRPATLDELKTNIREAIHDLLQRVVDGFTKRLQECTTAVGGGGGIYCFLFPKSEQYMYHT
jgi:hypothetical protein